MSPTNRKLIGLPINTRLAGYATLAGAALAAPVVADANIVYSGVVNIAIPLTSAGVYLNVETNVSNVSPAAVPGWDVNPFSSTSFSWFATTPSASSGYVNNFTGGSSATLVDNLAIGTPINGALGYTWATNSSSESTGLTAMNLNSDNNYIGFRFLNAASQLRFGWVQVHLGASFTDASRAIIGYAYQDDGTTILAGQTTNVPEPTTAALLVVMAAGALGVRAWRKQKAA